MRSILFTTLLFMSFIGCSDNDQPDETIIEHPGYTLDQLSSLTGYAERLVSFKRL